jgi:hypothetical protein
MAAVIYVKTGLVIPKTSIAGVSNTLLLLCENELGKLYQLFTFCKKGFIITKDVVEIYLVLCYIFGGVGSRTWGTREDIYKLGEVVGCGFCA